MASYNISAPMGDVKLLVEALDENGDGQVDYGEFTRGMLRLQQEQHGAVFGKNDTGVVHQFKKGGALGNQVMFNDNFGLNGTIGLKPMVLKHDLGVATDEPATVEELSAYTNKLSDVINTKYKMMRNAFRDMDEDKDGKLSKEELVQGVQHFSLPIPLSHIEEVFDKVMDKDENGGVSYVEFCEAMKGFDVKWAKTEAKMKAKKLS